MKKIYVSLLLTIFILPLLAQQKIKGRVLDNKERQPVVAATVTLHPIGSLDILSYTITDDKGEFILQREALPDSVEISVRAMTLETQTKRIKSTVDFVEFLVKEKVTELKEVIVKAPKVRQMGDTINYNVAAFTNTTDRTIGDILKKLPGIQVLSSGQILYQNKAISKFYIEGLDMLKGKYGIATNNVDASNVATVQVLENHQPIKALKDMEITEAAAINLRLKESAKGAFFATAQAGVGLPGLLLSNELVGMRFTRKQQNMMVYKGDNTGRDVAQEFVSFYDDTKNMGMNFLSVQMPAPPQINEQHSLFNDAHTVSLNDLRSMSKDLKLTGNLNFIHDKHTRESYSQRDIFLQNAENIHMEEDINAHLLKRELDGSLTLEGNTDNYFLNNKLKVVSKWNNRDSRVFTGNQNPIAQNLKLPEFQISNDFKYTLKKGNKRYRMGAFVGYAIQDHSLQVSPSAFAPMFATEQNGDSLLKQDVAYEQFSSKAFFSTGIKKRLSMWFTATAFTNHYRLKSDLYSGLNTHFLSADSLRNDFSRNELGLTGTTSFTYEFSQKFKPQISLPVTYLYVNRNERMRKPSANVGHVLFSPLLTIQYPIVTIQP